VKRLLARCLPALLALVSFTPASAGANGRFPRAERLLENPDDNRELWLAATYGLLLSKDRGQTWHHVCEQSFGLFPAVADPLLELSSAGVLGSLQLGVTLTRDGGCDFERVLGASGESTPDISVDRSDRARVLGLVKRSVGSSIEVALHESKDGGRSFEPLGLPLPPGFDFPFTVDSAPSDPRRVYVSGVSGENFGQVLRSDDGGGSWQEPLRVPGSSYVEAPYIAAVDPTRADLLYVRTDGRAAVDGQIWAHDTLYAGDLTGEEGCLQQPGFCELFSVPAKLLGFALSPDGSTALLGVGDPRDPNYQVDRSVLGLYAMSTTELLGLSPETKFPAPGMQKLLSSSISCVAWTKVGIYACPEAAEAGFALGFAPSLSSLAEEGLTPLLDLTAVQGPLACGAATSSAICREDWQETCGVLGACENEPDPAGAGGARPTPGPAAGTGAEPSTAGTRSANGGGSAEPHEAAPKSRASSCSARGPAFESSALVLGVLGLGYLVRRRRSSWTPSGHNRV
jgi:hypothetical protein